MVVPFFIYTERALCHAWLRQCDGFDSLAHSVNDANLAEVGLYEALRHHPWRVRDASDAQVFYVPVFEFTSHTLGECNGSSHEARMSDLHRALLSSPHYQRSGGLDHIFASTAWSAPWLTMSARMGDAARALTCATTGRYKRFPTGSYKRVSVVGRCSLEMPYQASLAATLQYNKDWTRPPSAKNLRKLDSVLRAQSKMLPASHGPTVEGSFVEASTVGSLLAGDADGANLLAKQAFRRILGRRRTMVQFSGALDVCCTGRAIRCAVGKLMEAWHDVSDVVMRPSLPTNRSTWGRCTRGTMERLALLKNASTHDLVELAGSTGSLTPMGRGARRRRRLDRRRSARGGKANAGPEAEGQKGGPNMWRYASVDNSKVEQAAVEMAESVFCLAPAGDNCVSARFYSAIAAGCIPVAICDGLRGAFANTVPYDDFVVRVKARDFVKNPATALAVLREMPGEELLRRQRALQAHRADVLYDVPRTRVGSHFLREVVEHCMSGSNNESLRSHAPTVEHCVRKAGIEL
ncbi:hypothetical protein EMIHUDRAFT_225873 [Emiliania huxleyi CCMP1516]|uniref:Exostosin GT47 domain-containing protein n=2 Tax=Emiliania huxleyi TaxID=2903 RepID=A0A0D3KN37_EMIH1|nr:hypothetical protein EMIHUDRAFT_245972 [Emiliania huxleyi CCMP1516]XP_005789601.1 hypothetical protein EMIHUDRAFT_225873 [Emiliania huxleyi CCMP1516]EOD15178.1 hypothetical protein EMIHUDRAFT_245972 [Emiliania huxleyi CCMP1516]EOD37172.1 hypothetical protein EMIHUDRAFT_225873 [Emiliania huxleyi CCMP1516]|eukprot:XP_005767607.1 hypothetical protein EMIHUDRAFT_245972 [Emiliania huxleyi CCMP1516]